MLASIVRILKPRLSRTMSVDIGGMRTPYHDRSQIFDVDGLAARDPFKQFEAWFNVAREQKSIEEVNAMCLSTATPDGIPSARMVLLKKFGPEGFTFYTNYTSRKGSELDANPRAALTFYWEPLKRSVRIEGKVERVSTQESDQYFQSRPKSSQIGAWVSDQSKVIKDRSVLTDKEAELEQRHGGDDGEALSRPPHWGGYRVIPHSVEFWQGQSNRVHDRIRFRLPDSSKADDVSMATEGNNGWLIERLAP